MRAFDDEGRAAAKHRSLDRAGDQEHVVKLQGWKAADRAVAVANRRDVKAGEHGLSAAEE